MNPLEHWAARWPNFKPEEVLSEEQIQLFLKKGVMTYSFRALDKLEQFRTLLGVPLTVNSDQRHMRGSRSMREVYHINKTTRPAGQEWGYSFHLWCAFDVSSAEATVKEIYEKAIQCGLWKGVGLYNSFVHVDDRDSFQDFPTIWDFRNGGQ